MAKFLQIWSRWSQGFPIFSIAPIPSVCPWMVGPSLAKTVLCFSFTAFDFFVRLISSSLSLSSFVPSEKVKLLIYTFFFTVETRTPISVFFGFHNLNQEEARTTTRWYKFIRSYIEAHAI